MRKLRPSAYAGYAAGDMANNLAFSMQGFFLMLYYTVVVGLNPAVIGTMFLVARLFDAVTDLVAGRLVDMTRSRWGKFRPYLLFGSVPLLLTNVALFTVPDVGQNLQYLYAWGTYLLLGLLYTLVNIPYGSLATVMTQRPEERSRLGSARFVGALLTILFLMVVISPQISELAGRPADLQRFFTLATAGFAVIGLLLYLFTFWACREQVARPTPTVTLRETLATFRGNRALAVLCLGSLVFLVGLFGTQTAMAFYASYVLGDSGAMVWIVAAQTVASFAVFGLLPRVVASSSKKLAFFALSAVTAVGSVALFLSPAVLPVVVAIFLVIGLGSGGVNALMFAMEADTVEYGEWRTGQRTEGATYAAFSFTRKVAQAVSGAVAGWALALGGFDQALEVQPDSALTAIRFVMGVLPAVFALAGGVLILRFFPFDDRRFAEILQEISARRDASQRTPSATSPQ